MGPEKNTLDALRIERSAKPPETSRAGVWLLLAVVLAVGGFAAWKYFTRPQPIAVRTLVVRAGEGGERRTLLNASGYVTPRREATVSSKVTGKVTEVMVEEGLRVNAGQVLARLDDANVKASLDLAQSQLEAARAALAETRVRLREAGLDLRRVSDLAREKIASPSQLDAAEAEVNSLEARLGRQQVEVSVAERQLALWQQQLDDTVIRAPFAGIVVSKNAQPGEMISPISAGGGFTRTGICTIVDMNSLEIEVDVNESYINRVESGQIVEATLDAYPAWKIPAKVIAIIPTADRQKATVKVRVGFDTLDPRILPQMGVKVAFQEAAVPSAAAATAGPRIPRKAVRQIEGRTVVWVVTGDRVERRAVAVAQTDSETATVAAGLNPGEKIVLEASAELTDGARIREGER